MAVNEQVLTLIPILYLGSMATDPRPYATLDAMRKAFNYLAHNKTPAFNGDFFFSTCFFDRSTVTRPVGAPARRFWARPGPSVVLVAFMADGIEP